MKTVTYKQIDKNTIEETITRMTRYNTTVMQAEVDDLKGDLPGVITAPDGISADLSKAVTEANVVRKQQRDVMEADIAMKQAFIDKLKAGVSG